MTWIRVDSTLPREAFIGQLAEELGLDLAAAVGLWVATALGFAEYQNDGMAERVTATSLEQWAGWRGRPGKYAAAFRSHCVEAEADRQDPPGRVKLWWRQEALVRKGEADAARLRAQREEEARRRAGVAQSSRDGAATNERRNGGRRAGVAGNDDDDDDGYVKPPTTTDPPPSAVAYAVQCCVACNTGLRDNLGIGAKHNPLAPSNQDAHLDWRDAGVPLDVAVKAIYERARRYRPSGRNRQPSTLRYFDQAVRDAHERAQLADAPPSAALAEAVLERDMTEAERLAAELTREAT